MSAAALRPIGRRTWQRYAHSLNKYALAHIEDHPMQIQQHKTQEQQEATYRHNYYPDAQGRFGSYGGQFVPESLMAALADLEAAYEETLQDEAFQTELKKQLSTFVGRPTSLYYVPRFSQLVAPD